MHASNHASAKELGLIKESNVGLRSVLLYIFFLVAVSCILLELGIRFLTKENKANVELFLGKKNRYLLPLPSDPDNYYQESIANEEHDNYRVFDDTLGWAHSYWGSSSKGFVCYSNDRGFRIDSLAYANRVSSERHYDIITIGNSFTHGDAVKAEDSWPYLLSKKSSKTVANLGVGGYGLQQALLRLMYSGISADTVLFGAIWGDFERALEPVYTFYLGGNKTRPIINFSNSGYQLINVPVIKPRAFYDSKAEHNLPIYNHIQGFTDEVFSDDWWTNSYLLRLIVSINHQKRLDDFVPIYLRNGEDLTYCMDIFQLFKSYCIENDMYPIVVLLDTRQNFYHKEKFGLENPWKLTKERLDNNEIPYVEFHNELYEAFIEDRHSLIHAEEGLHYSPQGNRLVSELLTNKLEIKFN